MKNYLALLFLFTIAGVTKGFQRDSSDVIITGKVLDMNAKSPIAHVLIDIQDPVQNTHISTSISDSTGSFTFNVKKGTAYKLIFDAMTHVTKTMDISVPKQIEQTYYDIGHIALTKDTIALEEISVTASRPLVRQEIDRIAYSVKDDPENSVQSTLDMMQKVPLMAVDGSNNVELKGSRNFKVLLNGRPSALFNNDLAGALRAIPANRIDRIEVIISPPAKYDSEGLDGLVNIVMLENNLEGFKGSVSAAYNNPFGAIGSTSATYKKGKIGVDGFLYYFNQSQPSTAFGGDANFPNNGRIIAQNGTQKYNGDVLNGNLQLNYEIDTLNTLIVSYNRKLNDFHRTAQLQQKITSSNQGISNFIDQNSFPNWRSTDVDVNYQHIFKGKKYKTLNFGYKHANSKNDIADNIRLWDIQTPGQSDAFDQESNTTFLENSVQVDYSDKIKNIVMETGAKISFRENRSTFYQRIHDATPIDFRYIHNVYNLYKSLEYSTEKYGVKVGARFDATTLPTLPGENDGRFFWRILPSVNLQQKQEKSSINLSYNQRIQRPNINEMNPFVDQSNPLFVSFGNPLLRPTISNNFNLSFSKMGKGATIFGLGYSFIDNNIEQITQLASDSILNTSFVNIGHARDINFNVSINQPITKKLRLNVNGLISYLRLKGNIANEAFGNDGFRGNIRVLLNYELQNKLRLGTSFNYIAPTVLLQGNTNGFPTFSFTASKTFLNEKLTIFGSVNNPFTKFYTNTRTLNTGDFQQHAFSQVYYRSFVVTLTYNFGKLKSYLASPTRAIKSDDIRPTENKLDKL